MHLQLLAPYYVAHFHLDFVGVIIDRKKLPTLQPPRHGALHGPWAWNQAGDWLIPSQGAQPQRTEV